MHNYFFWIIIKHEILSYTVAITLYLLLIINLTLIHFFDPNFGSFLAGTLENTILYEYQTAVQH